ncbi:MAG: PDZ domain-containing protein [Deltaproteobacteria bacterium]|nr:PDZ domain-containing protein [Deltaproteobacteria bacterium]
MKKRTLSLASISIVAVALFLAIIVVFVLDKPSGLDRKPDPESNPIARSLTVDSEELQSLSTMYRTITLVQQHYLDAKRIEPRKMLLEAMKELELDIAMLIAREDGNKLNVKIGNAEQTFPLDDLNNTWLLLSRFKDIYTFLKKNIPGDEIDFKELQYTAINGMLKALDPHTVLLTPDIYRSMKDRTHGNFGGLGIVISIRDGNLTIISPIDGTPAQRAGLKAGDIITKINEASTINMPINDAVDLMRGKPGTSVTLDIQRKNWSEEKSFRIKRAIIKVRSIDSASMPGKVGYIRIHDFQANTASDLWEHLQDLAQKNGGLNGLILDLRSNPGGLLSAAIDVSDIFLTEGVIVTTAGQKLSERKVEKARNTGTEPKYPIVILVNSGTASASEIVAGALKGHDRAIIIGERTFGKGSVQVLNEFPDNSALKLTTAQYLTPGDISIQSVGIAPNIELIRLRADKQSIHLGKSIRYREGDLNHHFENTNGNTQKGASEVTLKYLYTPEIKPENDDSKDDTDDDEGFEEDSEDITEQSTYNFKFEPDFEINLGREIALQLNGAKQTGFNKEALVDVFSRLQKKEKNRLANALSKLGIDWREGETVSPQITVETQLANPEKLKAGEENELMVSVTNNGSNTVYQLLAQTRSDFVPLNHKELAFGKVDAGQTVTRNLPFKIPQNYLSRTDDVKIQFEDSSKNSYPAIARRFSIVELAAPVFAFSTVFMDDVKGNSDGVLQPGEIIRLTTTIKNAGKGKAHSVFASVSNDSGHNIFLKKGRQELEEMQPGEIKKAEFEFEVKEAFTKKDVRLKLSVMDVKMRVFTTQALKYPVMPPFAVKDTKGVVQTTVPAVLWAAPIEGAQTRKLGTIPRGHAIAILGEVNGFFRVALSERMWGWIRVSDCVTAENTEGQPVAISVNEPPNIDMIFSKQVVRTDSIILKGTAFDEQLVKDLYIFNNQNKVFFAPNDGKKLAFEANIPLEPGVNFITVVAEETSDLETRQTVIVRRDKKDGMPYISSETIEGTPELLGVLPGIIESTADNSHP